VLSLIRQARNRILKNELLAQGANAFSAALAAFILLLLTGTQILSWEWLLLIPAGALAVGIWRAGKRTPSEYTVAQLIDRRLSLSDHLSTAWHFSQGDTASKVAPEIRQCQLERAEEIARTVDLRRAVPYTMPRALYGMAALLLVASSLFALRYGLSRSLDLKAPLAQMLQQQLGWTPRTEVAKDIRHKNPTPPAGPQDDEGAAAEKQDQQQGTGEPDAAQSQDAESAGQQQNGKNGPNPQGDTKQDADGKKGGEEGDAQAEDKADPNGDNSENSQQGGNPKSDQAQSGNKQDANSSENSSLLSKMKDAVQNLLSRVKPQQSNQSGQQQAGGDQGQKQQGNGKQNGGKQQQSAKNGQQSGDPKGDAQDAQSGDDAKNSQDQQGKGAGKSDTQQASKQPGSGIGSQDGDKSIKQAEQLAAMGKISEILGKRSANLTGESTVEVQNTSQTLRTQYVQRGAQHSQGGAAISRDEVPVALQSYVEQYFEQVRKQPAPAATPAKKQ
jgi:hypothetical protein